MTCNKCHFKLSILICSIDKRQDNFLRTLLGDFTKQLGEFKENIQEYSNYKVTTRHYRKKEVEILICSDAGFKRGGMGVGIKRNLLETLARGDYRTSVDDDDRVSDNYCDYLLQGIKTGKDVINFFVMFNSQKLQKLVEYSLKLKDHETNERFYRASNHLMCIKKSVSDKVPFKNLNFGEDADYAKRLKQFAKTEAIIPRVLYYYNFSHQTSETQ